MSFAGPNLARQPFVNLRPVQRAAAALWIAVALLGAWNVYAYLRSGAGTAEKGAELQRLDSGATASRARITTLEADLRRADLVHANLRTAFLNERIAERAFSWNLLFDRLAEGMPRGVRVSRLTPEHERRDARRASAAPVADGERRVALSIHGEAEDGESLLSFVDQLFAHAAFDGPSLRREARVASGALDFDLAVDYMPEDVVAARSVAAQGVAGDGAATKPETAARTDGATAPASAASAAGETPRAVGGPLAASASALTPERAAGPRSREALPPGARGANPGFAPETAAEPGAGTVAEETPDEEGSERRARPTPSASIFGVPLAVRPNASGGAP